MVMLRQLEVSLHCLALTAAILTLLAVLLTAASTVVILPYPLSSLSHPCWLPSLLLLPETSLPVSAAL
jgi:hypothetical protein